MSILTQDTSRSIARPFRILWGAVRPASMALNFLLIVGVLPCRASTALAADQPQNSTLPSTAEERFAIHGQFTYVEQDTDSFRAPYAGPNSLSPNQGRETTDLTLYAGARLWPGAEIWINPEIDQGFGLDNTLGVAGFPSGEAYKVGKNQPYFRLPRLFVRETLDLNGDRETIEAGANQLAGAHGTNRWVFTVGKFSVADIFDTNQYAHDPRNDFLNWAAIDTGSFDYAADAWGYTVGAAAEWYQGAWTTRLGLFDLSDVPNSVHLEPGAHEFQIDLELEKRHEVLGHAGKVLITVLDSLGLMGLLAGAVHNAQPSLNPVDVATVRRLPHRLVAVLSL